mmetsp:Transcript_25342/g.31170  ORF Transcript_25342/g.31170 Transcript_25342/m.31170 type:complete len:249 (-) Transcript_25342:324-1070(-)
MINCLPMCTFCTKRPEDAATPFKRCGACKSRTYCDKKCQKLDWKTTLGNHKGCCGISIHKNPSHQPWCSYLDRNPELDEFSTVPTGEVLSHPDKLITTGMNTCFFVVVKTTSAIIGWHASVSSISSNRLREKLQSISKSDFISGFIIPGEDREPETLNLKSTCRTMTVAPFTDPSLSRRRILGFLQQFEYYDSMQVMPSVKSYKDFVVFDMFHRQPYAFSDVARFDRGCTYDGAVDAPCYETNVFSSF